MAGNVGGTFISGEGVDAFQYLISKSKQSKN